MRTKLDIDEDILLAVKELAAARKRTVGKVISELVRRGLAATRSAERERPRNRNGFAVFPAADDTVVSVELIDKLLEGDV